jgi:hypothetical protein
MHREKHIISPVTALWGGGWRRYFRSLDSSKARHNMAGYFMGLYIDIRNTQWISLPVFAVK